MSIKRTRT